MAVPPQEFLCPITQNLMSRPVVCEDGNTYEEKDISEWLALHLRSPITNLPLRSANLVPNLNLRKLIEDWKQANGVVDPPAPPTPAGPDFTVRATASRPAAFLNPAPGDVAVHISVEAAPNQARLPCVVIAVIDSSGSMGSEAEEDGGKEAAFTRMDLVKHSIRSIIEVLSPADHLALVTFADEAKVVLPPLATTPQNRRQFTNALNRLDPDGGTHIWAGLKCGLDLAASERVCAGKNTVVLLFTDGEPTVVPPRGIRGEFQAYLAQHPSRAALHTFGFGYTLDSGLLKSLAEDGGGCFGFVPDCSMVGTMFVNAAANVLATVAPQLTIELTAPTGVRLARLPGFPDADLTAPQAKLVMGSVQDGQTRDLVALVRSGGRPAGEALLTGTVTVTLPAGGFRQFPLNVLYDGTAQLDQMDCGVQSCRLHTIDRMLASVAAVGVGTEDRCRGDPTIDPAKLTLAQNLLKSTVAEISATPFAADPRVRALLEDIESQEDAKAQASKALASPEWFSRWGIHYLPSLARAHQLQQRHNFKDPGVQVYGGPLFSKTQDAADAAFRTLPPPTSSIVRFDGTAVPTVRHMGGYLNYHGGCFDGACLVEMADGQSKRVDALAKGDLLAGQAVVRCVVRSLQSEPLPLVTLKGGLRITQWHPVRLGGAWVFPDSLGLAEKVPLAAVYNLVLSRGHVARINGVEVATLGHGFTDNAVIIHPYFGTEAVLKDLAGMAGWEAGCVELPPAGGGGGGGKGAVSGVLRDPVTQLVTRLVGVH